MGLHRNARLGLAGRRALVADIESGLSCRCAARRRGVSPSTACKWWRRWLEAAPEQRRSWSCLEDRSSLIDALRARLVHVGRFIDEQARLGDPGMQRLVAWDTPRQMFVRDVAYLDERRAALERALA